MNTRNPPGGKLPDDDFSNDDPPGNEGDPPLSDGEDRASEEFVRLLTAEQFRLQRYVFMLLGDLEAAGNVLQEANIAIWRKADSFQLGTNFTAWARKVAYWEVKAYLRDRARDRHVFGDQLVEQLATYEEEADPNEVEVRIALRHCMENISPSNRDLLRLRYEEGASVSKMAVEVGRSQSAVKVGLLRIRRSLFSCIQRQLSREA